MAAGLAGITLLATGMIIRLRGQRRSPHSDQPGSHPRRA